MVPGNMTTPPMKLGDGEVVVTTQPVLRRKGIFGNRYGELYLTNQRLAFVKAIMKSGVISALAHKAGAKPMVAFDVATITSVEKVPMKKQVALVVTASGTTEKFVIAEPALDELVRLLPRR